MYATGRQIEDITLADIMPAQYVADCPVCHTLPIFIRSHMLLKTGIQERSRLGIQYIPHLAFAGLVVFPFSHLIIRMDLNAQILLGINNLCQQRQAVMIVPGRLLAQDLCRTTPYNVIKPVIGPCTVLDNRLVSLHTGNRPVLSTPNQSLAVRLEQHRIQLVTRSLDDTTDRHYARILQSSHLMPCTLIHVHKSILATYCLLAVQYHTQLTLQDIEALLNVSMHMCKNNLTPLNISNGNLRNRTAGFITVHQNTLLS